MKKQHSVHQTGNCTSCALISSTYHARTASPPLPTSPSTILSTPLTFVKLVADRSPTTSAQSLLGNCSTWLQFWTVIVITAQTVFSFLPLLLLLLLLLVFFTYYTARCQLLPIYLLGLQYSYGTLSESDGELRRLAQPRGKSRGVQLILA